MLTTGIDYNGPVAVRYPRGKGPGVPISDSFESIEIGRAINVRQGKGIALLAFGSTVTPALEVAAELDATVINMRFVKPLDEAMIRQVADTHATLFTLEENVVAGGAGSGINEFINQSSINVKVFNIGLPDLNIEHGSREQLLQEAGLDSAGIQRTIAEHLKSTT